jgi:hypothetical protein
MEKLLDELSEVSVPEYQLLPLGVKPVIFTTPPAGIKKLL